MSGGMFQAYHPSMAHNPGELSHEAGQAFDQGEWNPLLCYLCHQVYIFIHPLSTINIKVYFPLDLSRALLACVLSHILC